MDTYINTPSGSAGGGMVAVLERLVTADPSGCDRTALDELVGDMARSAALAGRPNGPTSANRCPPSATRSAAVR